MKFTGERYIPSIDGQIRYEHMHRYAWCMSLVGGLDVLDLASGAGYGSALLSTVCKSVVGVDVSQEAVEFAKNSYGQTKNLKLLEGSASKIPVGDAAFDAVVSFETIEHLSDHAQMMSEIKRVLRPDGFLIISSPNRDVYSTKQKQINPFHERELSLEEFRELLDDSFSETRFYYQRIARASFLYPAIDQHMSSSAVAEMESLIDAGETVERRPPNFIDPVYFIAVAGPAGFGFPEPAGSVFASDGDALSTELHSLNEAVVVRDGQLRDLYAAIEAAESRVSVEREHKHTLAAALTQAEQRHGELEDETAALRRQVAEAESRYDAEREHKDTLAAALTQAEQRHGELEDETAALRRQVSEAESRYDVEREHKDTLAAALTQAEQRRGELEDETAALRRQVSEAEARCDAEREHKDTLAAALTQAEQRHGELEDETAVLRCQIVEAESRYDIEREHKDTLAAALTQAEQRHDELEDETAALRRQIAEAESRYDVEREHKNTLTAALAQAEQCHDELEDETAALRRQVAATEAGLNEALAEVTELSNLQLRLQQRFAKRGLDQHQILDHLMQSRLEADTLKKQLRAVEQGQKRSWLQRLLAVFGGSAEQKPSSVAHANSGASWLDLTDEGMLDRGGASEASALVSASGLFDAQYYLEHNRDVVDAGVEPLTHYLRVGCFEVRNPNRLFDSAFYLRRNADVDEAGINPLIHYIRRGEAEGRLPSLGFDPRWYLNVNPDVAASGWSPLRHFLQFGAVEGRRPVPAAPSDPSGMPWARTDDRQEEIALVTASGLFDARYYLQHNKDVADAGADPLTHYLCGGCFEARNPNRLFDSAFYLRRNSDVVGAGFNPLIHYIRHGEAEGRLPSAGFDPRWYLHAYPDIAASGGSPLLHFLQFGADEGRQPAGQNGSLAEIADAAPEELKQWFVPQAPYATWLSVAELTSRSIRDLRKALDERAGRLPSISLITPVYNTPAPLLRELIESVRAQIYDDWELCLVDDASPADYIQPLLRELASLDTRIRVIRRDRNGGISAATNEGVEAARGEIVAFLDHDDLITADCLAEIALYYADQPDADIVYSDDDKIDLSGNRFAPQFKPDWSPVLLLSYMYFSHIFTVRRELYRELGGFRSEFDGSQDYDFALRATERARHVGHVPRILYHWRAVPGSTAQSGDAKPESFEAGRKAVSQALERRGVAGKTIHPDWALAAKVGMFSVVFPDEGPEVTILIPTYNQKSLLKTCIDSLQKTTYKNFRIFVADNDSNEDESIAYLDTLKRQPRTRVVRVPKTAGRFSFAALINQAVAQVDSDYVLLLNNDTKVINPRWLSQMMGLARMPGVGSVGARLYFEDGTIQHAGIVHGYHEGLVGHAFRNAPPHDWGYMGFIRSSREYSAVTAACTLMLRATFDAIGGMDESNFAVAYNDVDLGYRLVQAGLRCVYCADAELFHLEGKTRPKKDDPNEVWALRRTYGDWHDRWYNPNLSLENEAFEPGPIRLPIRDLHPVEAVLVTHNLNFEGAPNTLLDLAIGLTRQGAVHATVLSPTDGPLRQVYEMAGIRVRLFSPPNLGGSEDDFVQSCEPLVEMLREIGAEVVVANTLQMFFAISAAQRAGCGAIWCQHESEPWHSYYDYVSVPVRAHAYAAFAQAYRVTYVADATRRAWRAVETRRNFRVIRHGIPAHRLVHELEQWTRQDARTHLGLTDDEIAVSVVGTVCRRKGQRELVEAVRALSEATKARLRVFIAGALSEVDYAESIRSLIEEAGLGDQVTLAGPMKDVTVYFRAADIYVCTSRIESAPRVLVEAMAFGLPIISTPVFGIPEIVDADINALFYDAGDVEALTRSLDRLITDDAFRRILASRSRDVLNSKPGFEEMVKQYTAIIREAAGLSRHEPVRNDVFDVERS